MGNKSGFSTLAIVIGLSIISVAVFYFSSSMTQTMNLRNQIQGRDGVHEVEDVLRSIVAVEYGQFLEKLLPNECTAGTGSRFNLINWSPYNARIQITPYNAYVLSGLLSTDPVFLAARTRCSTKQTFLNGGGSLADPKIGFYSCLSIDKGVTVSSSKNSLYNQPIFVEIFYAMWNFRTGQPMTCGDFKNSQVPLLSQQQFDFDSRGGQLYYTIHWQQVVEGVNQHFNHTGMMFVRSHD